MMCVYAVQCMPVCISACCVLCLVPSPSPCWIFLPKPFLLLDMYLSPPPQTPTHARAPTHIPGTRLSLISAVEEAPLPPAPAPSDHPPVDSEPQGEVLPLSQLEEGACGAIGDHGVVGVEVCGSGRDSRAQTSDARGNHGGAGAGEGSSRWPGVRAPPRGARVFMATVEGDYVAYVDV